MQQTFQCYRCGAQNVIGQPFCWNCQSPFQWNCPNCRALVQNRMASCSYCHTELPWPVFQTAPMNQYVQQQDNVQKINAPNKETGGEEEQTEKKNSSSCGCVSAIIILIGIVLFGVCISSSANKAPSVDPNILVNKDASQLVLTINDFESGWTRAKAEPATKTGARSAYYVYYYQGITYPPVVTNTVAVYPSIEQAKQVYNAEKPSNVSLTYPNIGNECFYNEAINIKKELVFRKNNVVVWVSLLQNILGDAEQYARKIENKIVP
jgi:hypothetical protein